MNAPSLPSDRLRASGPFDTGSSQPPLAVVTGAASGIGQALTAALLERGHEVLAIDHRDAAAPDPRARHVSLDVRDAEGMARLAEGFADRPVSHVFANAGIGGAPGDVLALPDAAWQWAWDVNVLGALRTLRLWWPNLRLAGGRAVATVSNAALISFPGAGPYRASKAALLAALEGLHYESRGSGVRVHALCPGMVRSEITDLGRYPEAATAMQAAGAPPGPFAAFLAEAMRMAEPASAFAARVLAGLEGDAPFYWTTHAEGREWIAGRHRRIEAGLPPFDDFSAPPGVRRAAASPAAAAQGAAS